MSNALNWFEIPVTDLPRAKDFYSRILRADLREESLSGRNMAILPYQNGGVGGAIIQGEGPLSRRVGGRRGERGWGVRVSPEGAALSGPRSDKVELYGSVHNIDRPATGL
ncbi:MAG TPA: VOC family protein [Thermoanaerobaculia bacterium]|jgi:catechol 2,3-dioxygenase-like lactoylglutathione lyase family enzyme